MGKSIIIIPSRLAASRLPNKPLISIKNKTLIMHVYENALKSQVGEVFVATCDDEIASEVKKNGGKFVMTDKMHTTGTDRVCEASKKLGIQDEDIVINVLEGPVYADADNNLPTNNNQKQAVVLNDNQFAFIKTKTNLKPIQQETFFNTTA